MIHLHWKQINNFGDLLSPSIVSFISKQKVCYANNDRQHYAVIGSFLGCNNHNTTVWGTGIINKDIRPSNKSKYCAVRGPLTRNNIIKNGGSCPEIYGDAGYFVSDLFPINNIIKKYKIGIIPHWRESNSHANFMYSNDINILHQIAMRVLSRFGPKSFRGGGLAKASG